MKLNLKKRQERDIVRVIMHCCSQEKRYNPYYGLIGEKLCQFSYDYKVTFQYAVWDLLKSLSNFDLNMKSSQIRKISNSARLLSHLVTLGAISVITLRV
jgi:nucleolar MIF4G domain-containing protein 1